MTRSEQEEETLSIEIPDKIDFTDLADIPAFTAEKPVYCRPKGKNFPCLDAIYWDTKMCYLLQTTISETH